MSNLDTKHVINLDLIKDRANNVIKFGLADVETSDFYLGLYNNGTRIFDENYIVTLYIVKPNGIFRNIKLKPKEGLKKYYCNLPDNLKNIPGEYLCQAIIFDNLTNEKKVSKSKFKYSVDLDLASEIAGIIGEEEQESILTNILNRLLTLENPVEPYATQKHVDECVSALTEEIDTIKVKDTEQDGKLSNIETKNIEQDNRLTNIETKDVEQDGRLVNIETKNTEQDNRLTSIEEKDIEQDGRLNSLENKVDGIDEKIIDTIEPTLDNHGNRVDTLENKDLVHESRMTNIESKNIEQDERLSNIETKNVEQDSRLDVTENRLANIGNDITNTMQPIIDAHTSRLDEIETIDVSQNNRLDAIEVKNQQQDDRLLDIEKVNKRQDIDIKCLYGASQTIDVTEESNSIYLQNSNNGFVAIDEIKGNTLVNCNKEVDKELILNGNINTSGDNTVTLTEGVDGGLVDVALEGNTLVNVSKTKDSTAITKVYTAENSGNHITLQGDTDGSCRPVITGNTLWIDNATEEVLTAFDGTKNLRLQSSFEDNLVTQEMVDSGEEVADNLGKYRVDYKVTGKNKYNKDTMKSEWWIGSDVTKYGDGTNYSILIPIKNNITYKLSYTGTLDRRVYALLDENYDTIKISNIGTDTITNDINAKYLLWYLNSTGIDSKDYNIQLEQGDTATSYEPYKESTKTLYLDSPLLEGDTIEEKDGGIYHVHRSELVAYAEGDETSLTTDKVNTLHQLETPTYELIEQSNLAIPSYANGHLDFNTAVPVEKVDFLPFSEELTYLYPSTSYTVQFISTKAILADLTLGGTLLLSQSIVAGLNRISITTPATLVDNKLVISGVGANISNVVVTDTDRVFGYFEGMKSVGECEDLEVVSNNKNLFDMNKFIEDLTSQNKIISYENGVISYINGTVRDIVHNFDPYGDIYVQFEHMGNIEGNSNIGIEVYLEDNRRLFLMCGQNIGLNNLQWLNDGTKIKQISWVFADLGKNSVRNIMVSQVPITDYIPHQSNTQTLTHEPLRAVGDVKDKYVLIDGKWYIERKCGVRVYQEGDEDNCKTDLVNTVYPLEMPAYEEIDYNPLEVYSGATHITTNSVIPCNITVKNHGYNCLLKPSTTYTISSNLGLNTVTTPSTLTEDCLRFMDTDTSDVTTMKDVLVLEGDWATKADLIPSNFSGIESAFEQEYDAEKGKYKVNVKVANEDKSQENNITFYINEPLRGVGDAKDKVYVKDDKVVVQRNCGSVTFDGSEGGIVFSFDRGKLIEFQCRNIMRTKGNRISLCDKFSNLDWPNVEKCVTVNEIIYIQILKSKLQTQDVAGFKQWLQQNPATVVYQLAEPTYEEVKYNDVKLFIESFKNSTLFYNSNVPVTSKLYYSYSVPLVDTVAQTASISDEQDSMIIDLATQCAIMEMYLM